MIEEEIYCRYLEALLRGDSHSCGEIVGRQLAGGIEAVELYTGLFQRSLYRVGELWESNRISVAVEHLASAITERMLAAVYPAVLAASTRHGRRAVLTCAVNEYHQLGARMVADIMESRGWDVAFLGANTPADDLLALLEERSPELLGLSVSIAANLPALWRMVEKVRGNYPRLDILVGGQAFLWGGWESAAGRPMVEYVPSLEALGRVLPAG
jgi:MerR family transcriptional regulator, light-induced transcriptional regulator